jgi:hypothetical protein
MDGLNIKEYLKLNWYTFKTTRNEESEVLSRESIQRVSDYGIEYVLQQNDVYSSLPPAHTCIRPTRK